MRRLLLAAALLAGCAHVAPPDPTPVPAPPAPIVREPSCETACARGETLGCGAGPDCAPACWNVQASGVFVLDVACLTAASSCAAWRACGEAR